MGAVPPCMYVPTDPCKMVKVWQTRKGTSRASVANIWRSRCQAKASALFSIFRISSVRREYGISTDEYRCTMYTPRLRAPFTYRIGLSVGGGSG